MNPIATTEPKDLADVSRNGNTPFTDVTNEMSGNAGYPARTSDDEIVEIVAKERDGQATEVLVAADGRKFVARTDATRLLDPVEEPKPATRSRNKDDE